MRNILLLYPPFCTPCSPPYSITNIYSFLKENLDTDKFKIKAIDLNSLFHKKKYHEYREFFKQEISNIDEEYKTTIGEFKKSSDELYSATSKIILDKKEPEMFFELFDTIIKEKPNIVCFSIVYSSQIHYTYALIKELKRKFGDEIKIIVGGPSVSEVVKQSADEFLKDEYELYKSITGNVCDTKNNHILDFSIYNLDDYFVPKIVLPIKTTVSCPHAKCTFCTHHKGERYDEFDLDSIQKTINNNHQKYVFIIDDMLTKKRALEIAKLFAEHNIKWLCQLRSTKDFDLETLQKLKEGGCEIIFWGVESGNDRILKLMKKGTNTTDIKEVLKNSHNAGIKNAVYIMFGFPTETKEECLESIEFLKTNAKNIDLVSCSTFGLQKDSFVYDNYSDFDIIKITTHKRTLLDDSIFYDVKSGLTQKEANDIRKRYKKAVEKINKFPRETTFFREHMLINMSK